MILPKRMEIIRKRSILIKTTRKFVVSAPAANETILCEQCAGQMLAAQATAVLHDLSPRDVYLLIESGEIHFVETDANEIYVCLLSIGKKLDPSK